MNLVSPFEDMAKRIAAIDPNEFAGAVVILPPGGEPIAFLTTDPNPDIVQFWASAKSRIEVRAIEAIDAAERQRQQHRAFGR